MRGHHGPLANGGADGASWASRDVRILNFCVFRSFRLKSYRGDIGKYKVGYIYIYRGV